MQFVSFALVCVIAVQALCVSAYPAAEKQAGGKAIEELHEEYNKAGDQLQADLKKARAREDFKGDAHVQALLDSIEEIDKKHALFEKDVMDPKHSLSESEKEKLAKDIPEFGGKTLSELILLKPEQRQDQLIRQILENLGEREELLIHLALKQGYHFF